MSCDQCGAINGHAYYCMYVNEQLPTGYNPQKPVRYVAELADWLKQVNKIIKQNKDQSEEK